ncbi:MAG: cytochrome c [Rhodobacteraceae bacterium]|nr:cytochrome c [Paracoccaceae bacterium]
MTDHTPLRRQPWVPLPVAVALVVIAAFVGLKLVRPVIPQSVILLYMGFIVLGLVIHITLEDTRIARFSGFFQSGPGEGILVKVERVAVLALLPAVAAWATYAGLRPQYAPPVEIFQRHPTVGEATLAQITVPAWAADPATWREADIAAGKVLYTANCAVCHGENLDGLGPAAAGFRYPIRPANFRDVGTIAQLTLPYVYWRLTTGGLQNQFNSAMPRWVAAPGDAGASALHSNDLTPDEGWQVILYLYRATGYTPRVEALPAAAHASH